MATPVSISKKSGTNVALQSYPEFVNDLCASYAVWYVLFFGSTSLVLCGTAFSKGFYVEAVCQLILSVTCFIVPPYVARTKPRLMGMCWCAVDTYRAVCLCIYAFVGCTSFKTLSEKGGGTVFLIIMEIIFGPYHQFVAIAYAGTSARSLGVVDSFQSRPR
eukprot:gene4714-18574_t